MLFNLEKGGALEGYQIVSNERYEALQIQTSGRLGIYYQGHMQNIGWGNWISSAETTLFNSYIGTTGQSRRLEAVDFILYEQMF